MNHQSHHSHHSLKVEREPYRVNLPSQINPRACSPYLKSLVRLVRNGENGASGPEKPGAGTWRYIGDGRGGGITMSSYRRRWTNRSRKWKMPRYLPDALKQFAETEHTSVRLYHVPIYHDSWCRLLAGKGQCNCNPVVGEPSPEQ